MSDDTRTDAELRAAVNAGEAAERELARRGAVAAKHNGDRLKRLLEGDASAAFDASELNFAAYARCECGSGLAYPPGVSVHGAWHCSAVLRGTAQRDAAHAAPLPFAFYEIKSETQPSANGSTTRDGLPAEASR